MNIRGFQKNSLIDYPGEICSIIFTQGCNFRCPYCHNPELVEPASAPQFIPPEEIIDHICRRRSIIPAVTITGGEPTLQHDLVDFIAQIKEIGVKVKLDSNGTNPRVLKQLIDRKLVDYLAMDIKAPIDRYQDVTNRTVINALILESIKLIMNSGVEYEFRTTIIRPLLSTDDFHGIGRMIKGAKRYALQQFHKTKTLRLDNERESDLQYSSGELKAFQEIMREYVQECLIRE